MRRRLTWAVVLGAALLCLVAYAERALATPAIGFVGTTLAVGRFGPIDVSNVAVLDGSWSWWMSTQRTNESSDLYVQSNVWAPGGTTGWHSHPGHSLIIVTAGAVTAYESDDPSCTPHVYTQGMGFVDPGGEHFHVLRNEGTVEAKTIAVQLLPANAGRRIDGTGPAACPF
jgi:hypothetical protein